MNIHHPVSTTSRQRPCQAVLSGACLLLLATPVSLLAVTETWDGGGADNKLSTASNWLDNSVPANDSSVTNLVFAGSTRLSPLVDGPCYCHSLTFAPGAGAFQIAHPAGTYHNLYVSTGGVTNQTAVMQHIQRLAVSDDYAAPTPIAAGAGGLTIDLLTGFYNQQASVLFQAETVMSGNISVAAFWGPGTMTYNGGGTLTLGPIDDCPMSLTLNSGTVRTKGPFYVQAAPGLGSTNTFTLNGGSLLPEDNFILEGFLVDFDKSASAVFTMPAGKTFYIRDGATADFTGSYSPTTACTTTLWDFSRLTATTFISIKNGAALHVYDDSTVTAGSYLDVGNGSAGTLEASGPSAEVMAAGTSDWGYGAAGTVSFSDGAKGTFDTLRIAGGLAGAASNGATVVENTAALMTGPLQIGTTPVPGAKGTLTVKDGGSAVTLADGAALSLGSASGGSGTLNVESSAVFNTGLALSTVSATGKIKLSGNGTLNLIGDMTISGGTLESALAAAGGVAMSAGHTLRMQSGGDALFAGSFTLDKASGIQVSGAGSSFVSTGGSLVFKGGSTVTVDAGGTVSANQYLDIGNGGSATMTVSGAGSSLSSGGSSICDWGNNTGSANVTFSSEAQASTGVLRLVTAQAGSNATVLVQSGADLNTTNITAGTSSLAGSASLTVTGAGSTLTQAGAAAFALGAAANTTATFNTGTGAVVQTGTGPVAIAATGAVNMNGGSFTARGPLAHNGQLSVTDGAFTANVSAALNGGITTGPAGMLTFKGAVTGTSQFSGTGHVDFAGSYSPGAGPGAITTITFQPDVAFKPTNTLTMEIAGTASMDKLIFAGAGSQPLAWGGSLNVVPAGGFQPQVGQSFDLFDFDINGTIGVFANISLPSLPPGLFWRTHRLYADGVIFVSNTPQFWNDYMAAYALSGFHDDEDGDGLSNGLEMLLGTHPRVINQNTSPLARRSVVTTVANTLDSFMFEMPENPPLDGFYRIASSSDLKTWQTVATKGGLAPWNTSAGVSVSVQGAGPDRVRATITETLPAGAVRRFHRLEAILQ